MSEATEKNLHPLDDLVRQLESLAPEISINDVVITADETESLGAVEIGYRREFDTVTIMAWADGIVSIQQRNIRAGMESVDLTPNMWPLLDIVHAWQRTVQEAAR